MASNIFDDFNIVDLELQEVHRSSRFELSEEEIPKDPSPRSLVDEIFEKFTTSGNVECNEDCRICMKKSEQPIRCQACKKLVGCLECCKRWASASMGRASTPSCPLCRSEWTNSDSVVEVTAEDVQANDDQ